MSNLDSQVSKLDLLLEELDSSLGELNSLLNSPGGLLGRMRSWLNSSGHKLLVACFVARVLSTGSSVSRPDSQVQELDSLLYNESGA